MQKTKRNRYRYALAFFPGWTREFDRHAIESKVFLSTYHVFGDCTVICDDQPYNVLKGMLKLLEEKK